jgi:hypothetical protein
LERGRTRHQASARARPITQLDLRSTRSSTFVTRTQRSEEQFLSLTSRYIVFIRSLSDLSTVNTTMDAQRLLGMLNGGPSAAATSSTSPSPAQHSPRMSSPPATLQSLLSQLQSPQPPSPRESPPHMMSPPISDAGNAAELFRSAGMLPNIPPPPPSHPGGVPGPNHHRVLSPSAGNAQSLLATLMSG